MKAQWKGLQHGHVHNINWQWHVHLPEHDHSTPTPLPPQPPSPYTTPFAGKLSCLVQCQCQSIVTRAALHRGVGNLADDRWLVPLTRSGCQSERKIWESETEREREGEKIYPDTAGASVLNNTLRRKEMRETLHSFLFAGNFKGTARAYFHYSCVRVICVLNHVLNWITLDLNKNDSHSSN